MSIKFPSKKLGNLIRLTPLHTDETPAHPDIKDSDESQPAQRPELLNFLQTILDEGQNACVSFHVCYTAAGKKSSPPSASPVDVLTRNIPSSEIPWKGDNLHIKRPMSTPSVGADEYWVARRSYHEDKKVMGSAEWSEFEYGLRDDHSKHEQDFTPTLYDAYKVVDWSDEIRKIEGKIQRFNSVTMSIHEMCHALQFPLKPRCFPVLVVTANCSTDPEPHNGFVAVTIPIALSAQTAPTSFYSSGRNLTEGSTKQHRAKPIFGTYAAVERVKPIFPEDTTSEPGLAHRQGKVGQIEWIMATASDAKGSVPMFAQKMGIPGAIVKDVGLFLSWIRKLNPV